MDAWGSTLAIVRTKRHNVTWRSPLCPYASHCMWQVEALLRQMEGGGRQCEPLMCALETLAKVAWNDDEVCAHAGTVS